VRAAYEAPAIAPRSSIYCGECAQNSPLLDPARPLLNRVDMTLCASCRTQLPDEEGLCRHHDSAYGDQWAASNRIMCDFLHRKKVPPRLEPAERDNEFSEYPDAVA
jgi:hypothetical protein